MCGRYVQVNKIEFLEKRFNVKANGLEYAANYNIAAGTEALVITLEEPKLLQKFRFGLTPAWAKKPMYLINARAEGDGNKENDPLYSGGMGIINKPAFRYAIRNSRCLVIADAFYEGPEKEKLSKPYLVYLRERKPFAFAGIYAAWTNRETGEHWNTFAIITTVANELMQKIGHHRSPVILPEGMERRWISDLALSEVTACLRPYDYRLMNAYPVSPAVKSVKNNSRELVQPTGERIYPEYDVKFTQKLKLEGMGRKRKE